MAHDVFISYSTKDKLVADAACARLETAGVRCWIAPRDILPSAEWGEAIVDAITSCRVMILIFSRNANESPQISREVERAVNKGVALLPVRIEDIAPTKSLEYFIGTVHWLDALTPPLESHLERLAESVRALLQAGLPGSGGSRPRGADPAGATARRPALAFAGPAASIDEAGGTKRGRPYVLALAMVAAAVAVAAIAWIAGGTSPGFFGGAATPAVEATRSYPVPVKPAVAPLPAAPPAPIAARPQQAVLMPPAATVQPPAAVGGYPVGVGQSFRDCADCPEMVVVPAGQFAMGDRELPNSQPVHEVSVHSSFAVGKYDVTFEEWDGCVRDGGCRSGINDEGWGRGRRPAIDVTWEDAKAYAAWLARKTGKPYRLLAEAEWEYAARAGTTAAYYWGNDIGRGNANCAGCGSQWDNRQTAPVGSFTPNAFGLYDMLGNVWQWAEDCWVGTYASAPRDSAVVPVAGGCGRRVARGASWSSVPLLVRVGNRLRDFTSPKESRVGFRLARNL